MANVLSSSLEITGKLRRTRVGARAAGPAAVLVAVALAMIFAAVAIAVPNYPELTGRIVDNANLLTAEDRTAIEAELTALEATSTDQIAVVTVPSLDGYPIEDYGIGIARKWQIGQKDKDNGIIVIVAPNERKVRIEVGRRLEPLMTDTMSKLIIENAILSKFRRGDFSGGIRDGVRDVKAVLLGDAEEVKTRAKIARNPQGEWMPLIHFLVIFGIFALVIYINMRAARDMQQTIGPDGQRRTSRRRGYGSGPIFIPGGSGGWSGGGGGGWSGGGGGFGGGGASGDW